MNSALIFICSDQIGPYLNALSYLSDKRGVSKFTFVFITGAMMEGPQTIFTETIISTLERLADGVYFDHPVTVDAQTRARYASLACNLRASPNLTEVVSLEELTSFLTERARKMNSSQLLIDVTGLPKILTAHVMLICLVGGYQVHAFELRHKVNRNHPELSLYFSLSPGDFDYPPLTRDPAVQASVHQLVHVRRVMWTTALVSTIGVICFAALLLIDSTNTTLAVIGLTANVIGISSGVLQALTTRIGP